MTKIFVVFFSFLCPIAHALQFQVDLQFHYDSSFFAIHEGLAWKCDKTITKLTKYLQNIYALPSLNYSLILKASSRNIKHLSHKWRACNEDLDLVGDLLTNSDSDLNIFVTAHGINHL